MIKPSENFKLFPTLISEYNLNGKYDKNRIMDCVYSEIKAGNVGYSHNLTMSYLPGYRFLDFLPDLQNSIMECVNDYAKRAGFKPQVPQDSWFTVQTAGASFRPHRHHNCHLSCTFYPIFPAGSARLIVYRPMKSLKPENQFTDAYSGIDTEYNTETYTLPIKEGRLYVWPAWLVHTTEVNTTEERVVIPLNTINKEKIQKK